MAGLMVCDAAALRFVHDPALSLQSGDGLLDGFLKLQLGDLFLIPSDSEQGSLVTDVCQIGTGKTCRSLGDLPEVHILCELKL